MGEGVGHFGDLTCRVCVEMGLLVLCAKLGAVDGSLEDRVYALESAAIIMRLSVFFGIIYKYSYHKTGGNYNA